MSTFQVWKIVRDRAAATGLDGITPHDLRRYTVCHLLDKVDLVLVADIAGHVKTQTTTLYDRRPDARRREAIAMVPLPSLAAILGRISEPERVP